MTFVECIAEVADQYLKKRNNIRFMLSGNASSTVSSGTAISGNTTTTT